MVTAYNLSAAAAVSMAVNIRMRQVIRVDIHVDIGTFCSHICTQDTMLSFNYQITSIYTYCCYFVW